MEKLPDEVIEQIKAAVSEVIRAERENDRLRQEIQAQWEFYKQCERHRQITKYMSENFERNKELLEKWVQEVENA